MLIGGQGTDTLDAGDGDDLLLAMMWTHEDNQAALQAIHAEWTRDDAGYDGKRDHLIGAAGDGLNGGFVFGRATLVDDDAKDTLKGSTGRDLFFATLGGPKKDNVKDRKSDEDLLQTADLL